MEPTVTLAATDIAKGVFGKLFARPAEEAGELLADWMRHCRLRSQRVIAEKTEAYAKKHNLTLKPIVLKALVPLLEGASMEDDPTVQEIWARLIANASSIEAPANVTIFAADFLRGISAHEARIVEGIVTTLERAYRRDQESASRYADIFPLTTKPSTEFRPFRFIPYKSLDRVDLDSKRFDIALDNLVRFNILSRESMYDMDGRPSDNAYTFSRLGWEVVQLLRERSAVNPQPPLDSI